MQRTPNGYSADVDIKLVVNGRALDVAQLFGNTIILRDCIDHPPGPAELVLKIDEFEHRWSVRIPHGLSSAVRTVTLES